MRYRVRTKGELIKQPAGLLYHIDYGEEEILQHVLQADSVPNKMEYMADVVGSKQSEYNPCKHWKLLTAFEPITHLVYGGLLGDTQLVFNLAYPPGPYLHEILSDTVFLSVQDLDDFSAEAEDHFRTVVDDDQSLINFIIELIDICQLQIDSLIALSKKAARAFKSFWSIFKKSGSYWVAWNFAIRPFIRDVKGFLDQVHRARKRLRWLKKHNHKPVKVRFQWPVKEFSIPALNVGAIIPWSPDPNYNDPPINHEHNEPGTFYANIEGTVKLRSWAHIKFDIPDYLLDDMIYAMGMIIATMQGIYNPVKIAWEAIPFSWLIDWFSSKRTQLQRELASMDPFGTADILAVGWSAKVKAFGFVDCIRSPEPDIPIGNFQWEMYLRTPGLPTGNSPVWSESSLDLRQLSILAGIGVNWRQRR